MYPSVKQQQKIIFPIFFSAKNNFECWRQHKFLRFHKRWKMLITPSRKWKYIQNHGENLQTSKIEKLKISKKSKLFDCSLWWYASPSYRDRHIGYSRGSSTILPIKDLVGGSNKEKMWKNENEISGSWWCIPLSSPLPTQSQFTCRWLLFYRIKKKKSFCFPFAISDFLL